MKPIKVIVHGVSGKMGQEVVKAVCADSEMEMAGAVELEVGTDSLPLPGSLTTVPFSSDLRDIITRTEPDVLVDFTTARAVPPTVRIAAELGVNVVTGTTGLSSDEIKEIEQLALTHQVGVVVAPNFALGAVLMMHLAKIASQYFDYGEIIELHHHLKADAPSGTALLTARLMAGSRGKRFIRPAGSGSNPVSRGDEVEGVTIHSVRLPGLLAHQEVLLGTAGQTLSIRHDTTSRECYMPGVILAIKQVINIKGMVFGLDTLLGLKE